MRHSCKSVLALWAIGLWLGVSAPAQAASGVGPYYATPSWDQTLPAATRFIVLTNMNSDAVLDRETGLVWEKVPSATAFDWHSQSGNCINLNTGGRTGWRLPTVQELLSLVDRSASSPSLPSGHPFTVESSFYWSATGSAPDATHFWGVDFSIGSVGTRNKLVGHLAWCVRGGQGVDLQ